MIVTALSDHSEHILIWLVSSGGTAAILKTLNYVSKQLPPLPPNAGWWTQFLYALVKGASFHDPKNNKPTAGA